MLLKVVVGLCTALALLHVCASEAPDLDALVDEEVNAQGWADFDDSGKIEPEEVEFLQQVKAFFDRVGLNSAGGKIAPTWVGPAVDVGRQALWAVLTMFAFVQISDRSGTGTGALFFLIMVETSAFAIAPPAVDAGTTAANVLLGIKLLCLAKRTSAATVSVSAVCTTCIMACIVLQQFWWADWSTYWNTVIHPAWSEWSYGSKESVGKAPDHTVMPHAELKELIGQTMIVGLFAGFFFAGLAVAEVFGADKKAGSPFSSLTGILGVAGSNLVIIAFLAMLALVVELVAPTWCDYPFVFDPLTPIEMIKIALSPYMCIGLAIATLGIWGGPEADMKKEGRADLLAEGASSFSRRAYYLSKIIKGTLVSAQAGALEEIQFRWLMQPVLMVTVRFIMLLPFLTKAFEVQAYVYNVLTRGLVEQHLNNAAPNEPAEAHDAYVYAAHTADILFSLAHSHQGWIGVLIKPIGCVYDRYFMYEYGLLGSIFAHFVWDCICFNAKPIVWFITNPSIKPGSADGIEPESGSSDEESQPTRTRKIKRLVLAIVSAEGYTTLRGKKLKLLSAVEQGLGESIKTKEDKTIIYGAAETAIAALG